jgi:hypothetical protein
LRYNADKGTVTLTGSDAVVLERARAAVAAELATLRERHERLALRSPAGAVRISSHAQERVTERVRGATLDADTVARKGKPLK